MNWSELQQLIARGEGLLTEFKESLPAADRLAASLVAFANSSGGQLVVGVQDDGQIVGVGDVDAVTRFVDNVAVNNCRPPITVVPEAVFEGDRQTATAESRPVMVFHVPKGGMRPYATSSGRYYIRTGSGRRDASREELLRLFQDAGDIFYDESPLHWLSIADLKMAALDDYVAAARPDLADGDRVLLLTNWGLLRDGKPTVAGLLLFGQAPQAHLPHASVVCARFPGTDSSAEPADLKELTGRLPDLIEQVVAFLRIHLPTAHRIAGIESELHPAVPGAVLREAVVNAVAHRDYTVHGPIRVFVFDDRVEVRTPGRPPNTVDEGAMRAGVHIVRNPRIYSRLADAGLVTNAGTGIRRMIALIKEHTGQELGISISPAETVLTIPRRDSPRRGGALSSPTHNG